jgi:hypothetical protein
LYGLKLRFALLFLGRACLPMDVRFGLRGTFSRTTPIAALAMSDDYPCFDETGLHV